MELKLEHVHKSYTKGKSYAVKDFDVTFTPGIYGILGPNGAGKSTLMGMITNNLKPSSGKITYNGKEISKLGSEYRSKLGYMPQQQGLYEDFSGEKFLWYMAALKGLKQKEASVKIEEMLEVVNLQEVRHQKVKSYSGGMKQRILIAQALMNEPDILILDEPTAGLDPKERIRIRNFISEIAKNKIVLFATHVVSDIEYISKSILLMKEGNVLKYETAQELLRGMEGKVFEVIVSEEEKEIYEEGNYKVSNLIHTNEKICMRLVGDVPPKIGEVSQVHPNLEDMYLYYIGI